MSAYNQTDENIILAFNMLKTRYKGASIKQDQISNHTTQVIALQAEIMWSAFITAMASDIERLGLEL